MTFPFDDATQKLITNESRALRALLTEEKIPHVEHESCTRLTWVNFHRAGFRLSEDGETVYTPVGTFASGNVSGRWITLSALI